MSILYRNKSIPDLFKNLKVHVNGYIVASRKFSSNEPNVSSLTEEDVTKVEIDHQREMKIHNDRHVSRLNVEHRNILNNEMPFDEPIEDFHRSVKYRRKMYGKYGSSSGVNPGVMWPTKEDILERKEYESVAYPLTIQEMVKAELDKIYKEKEIIMERQKKIAENHKNLKKWIHELEGKRAVKIKSAAEAKAKKDKLIEEVRRDLGYAIDTRDDRFIELLEQKEKELKRVAKQEKKKRREEMFMQEMIAAAENQKKD